jgi:hypothetical protein
MAVNKKRLKELNKAAKKQAEEIEKNKPERKIYRDFTLDEFDEFTMELQSLGAGYERGKILQELQRRRKYLFEAHQAMGTPDGPRQSEMLNYAMGMSMAIRFIEKLPKWEDNIGCPECGAI